MRFAAFIVCFYFLFVTTTAYALGPLLPVIVGSANVLVRGSGVAVGAVVIQKAAPPIGRKATAWCIKNKKCRETIEEMLEIDLRNDRYSECQHGFGDEKMKIDEYINYVNSKVYEDSNGKYGLKVTERGKTQLSAHKQVEIVRTKGMGGNAKGWQKYSANFEAQKYRIGPVVGRIPLQFNDPYSVDLYVKCSVVIINNNDNREQVINNINNRLTQDQRQQIVNNYYNENQQEFNNYVNNYCTQNSCNEVSEKVENQIRGGKIQVDNVTTAKCHTERGVILSCDNELENEFKLAPPPDKKPKKNCKPRKPKIPTSPDQLSIDFDDDCEEETPEQDFKKPEPKQPLINCDTSKMFREFCQFMDWADDEADKPGDEKVKVKEKKMDEPDDDKIDVSQVCPSPENITITVIGYTTTIVFDYKPYCDFAFKTRPYIVSAAGLAAMYVLSGRRT